MHDLALQYVETLAEPCAGFAAPEIGSPVCSACGWLDHEHTATTTVPEPRQPRVRRAATRRRLAAAS